jgi:hypothetical protein
MQEFLQAFFVGGRKIIEEPRLAPARNFGQLGGRFSALGC